MKIGFWIALLCASCLFPLSAQILTIQATGTVNNIDDADVNASQGFTGPNDGSFDIGSTVTLTFSFDLSKAGTDINGGYFAGNATYQLYSGYATANLGDYYLSAPVYSMLSIQTLDSSFGFPAFGFSSTFADPVTGQLLGLTNLQLEPSDYSVPSSVNVSSLSEAAQLTLNTVDTTRTFINATLLTDPDNGGLVQISGNVDAFTVTFTEAPEPSTAAMLFLSGLGVVLMPIRRRWKLSSR